MHKVDFFKFLMHVINDTTSLIYIYIFTPGYIIKDRQNISLFLVNWAFTGKRLLKQHCHDLSGFHIMKNRDVVFEDRS